MRISVLIALLVVALFVATLESVTRLAASTWLRAMLFALAVFFVWGPVLFGMGFLLKKALRVRCRNCGKRTLEFDPQPHMMIIDPPPTDWFETEFWGCHNCGVIAKRVRGAWYYVGF